MRQPGGLSSIQRCRDSLDHIIESGVSTSSLQQLEKMLQDPDFPKNSGAFYQQVARTLPGLAGESRITDPNSSNVGV